MANVLKDLPILEDNEYFNNYDKAFLKIKQQSGHNVPFGLYGLMFSVFKSYNNVSAYQRSHIPS